MLYTAPNTSFIEKTSGETVTTINDTSGQVATVQAGINTIRGTNASIIIVVRLLGGATYGVTNAGLVLGSQECLVASGATVKAASAAVTVPLVTISSGSTNVSIAGGTLDGSGANINGISAPAASRVNVDKVTVQNCGSDGILLKGQGNSTFDNEMTVTRCEVSGSPAHAGISIQNSTQSAVLDNYCHNNSIGIWIACAYGTFANNVCNNNSVGIDYNSGDDNVIVNNTCNNNATGMLLDGASSMIASDAFGGNSTAGINSGGSGNIYADNLFTAGNAVNFISAGSGDKVIAYKTPLNAPGQDYFYPPLTSDQHTNTIVNGMGRTDLTNTSTTIDAVQSQYYAARSANPNNVMVLHLNGTFTVGATPLTLQSNTCVLLNGTIQISSSTAANQAITGGTSPSHVSISGGVIDGANLTGNNGVYFSGGTMIQLDAVTLQNFGPDNPRIGSSDVVRFTGGSTPSIITRCLVNGGAARGIWLENSGVKHLVSDCEVTAVNMDGVDCDASTSGSVVKFNYCHDLVRYGVFFEQSASHNLALGNICNNDGRDINVYNNSTTPRGSTADNSILCNSLMGNNGLRNGSTGTNVVTSSHNFFFDNTVINASISSELYGTENYYSQNYLAGGTLSTAGVESFFNSSQVSSNLFVQDGNSGLAVLVANAATNNGAAIVTGQPTGLGNDQWALIPTDSGYYRITSKKSNLVMAVQGASTSAGASIVQWAFGSSKNDQWMPFSAGNGLYYFVNRLSGLCLEVAGAGTSAGTLLDQQPYTGGANQQFKLPLTLTLGSFSLSASPGTQAIQAGSNAMFTVSLSTNGTFSGSVNFGVSGLPANAGANFSPATLSANGSTVLTVTTATNTPAGNYTLTINGTNGVNILSATVLLAVSGLTASPGTMVWTGGGTSLNWPVPLNWTNTTAGGAGPPGIANDVVFTNLSVTASNVVNNIVNSDTGIGSLTDNNTNGFHVTQMTAGSTLTIAGSKGLMVGTESDLGGTAAVYEAMTGAGGELAITNPGANLIVRQGASAGGSQRATLDLSGLDTFTASLNQVSVGVAGPAVRETGTLELAKVNTVTATGSPGILVGDNSSNSGGQDYIYLGQDNSIFADTITIGRQKASGTLAFNPGFTNPFALFRGADGVSRVATWLVGDNSPQSSSSSATHGTVDLSGGTVDALVGTLVIGKSQKTTGVDTTGVLTFAGGTLDVNTLQAGFQAQSGATSAGIGTLNVNGAALLNVNTILELGHTSGGAGTANTSGTLNVNGGTVQTTNLAGSGGISTVNLNSGTINLQGGQAANVSTLNIGTAGGSLGALLANATSIQVSNTLVIAANGTMAGDTFVTAPGLIVNGTVSPGVNGDIGAVTNSGGLTLGAGGNLVVTVQNALGAPVTGWSFLQTGGRIDVQATNANPFTIQVQSFDPNGSGEVTNFDAGTNYNWVIGTGTGGITNFSADKFTVDASAFNNDLAGGTFSVQTNGNSLVLVFTSLPPVPAFGSIQLGGTNAVFSGTGGRAGGTYYLLATTNLALPLNQWPCMATNAFDGGGNFIFTNPVTPDATQQFYRLQLLP